MDELGLAAFDAAMDNLHAKAQRLDETWAVHDVTTLCRRLRRREITYAEWANQVNAALAR